MLCYSFIITRRLALWPCNNSIIIVVIIMNSHFLYVFTFFCASVGVSVHMYLSATSHFSQRNLVSFQSHWPLFRLCSTQPTLLVVSWCARANQLMTRSNGVFSLLAGRLLTTFVPTDGRFVPLWFAIHRCDGLPSFASQCGDDDDGYWPVWSEHEVEFGCGRFEIASKENEVVLHQKLHYLIM